MKKKNIKNSIQVNDWFSRFKDDPESIKTIRKVVGRKAIILPRGINIKYRYKCYLYSGKLKVPILSKIALRSVYCTQGN